MAARYEIFMTPTARRDVKRLPAPILRRVDQQILSLAGDPFPRDAKKLEGVKGLHRVRVGDYRIVYAVDTERRVVTVARIGDRREVYR